MAEVQKSYVKALETGKVDFSVGNYNQPETYKKKATLREHFKKMDEYMIEALKGIKDINGRIDWGLGKDNPNIMEHLQFLIQHEILPHGQLVAFAYLLSLPIPESMINNWAFPLNETQRAHFKKRTRQLRKGFKRHAS